MAQSLLQQMANNTNESGQTTDAPQSGQIPDMPPIAIKPLTDDSTSAQVATPSPADAGQVLQAAATGTPVTPPSSPPPQEPATSPVSASSQPTSQDPLDSIIDQHVPKSAQKDSLDNIIDNHVDTNAASTGQKTSDVPWYKPQTSDMSYRLAEGLQDPLIGIGQLAVNAADAVGLAPKGYAHQINKEVAQRDKDYQTNHPVNGIDVANLAGNIVSPINDILPLKAISSIGGKTATPLVKVGRSALAGATQMAAQPTDTEDGSSYAGGKLLQTGEGALLAGGGSALGNAAAKVISPKVSDDVQTLLDNNIRVNTDQMGGTGGSKLTSLPIVGGLISAGHNRAVEDLNTAVLNKALATVGEKIPPSIPQAGNDALSFVRNRLSDNYEQLLPHLSGNINDQTTNTLGQKLLSDGGSVIGGDKPMSFNDKFSQMMQDKYYDMHLQTTDQLGKILQKEIGGVVGNDGSFTGEQFKNMETGLNYKISNYSASPDPQHRMMANALKDTKGLLRDQLSASNPEGQQALQNINQGYSIFKTAQKAASSTAAPNGVFNPAQLYNAVKTGDTSLDKRAFTEGNLPLYDLASAGKNVLSDYKNSGTADRGLAAAVAGFLVSGGLKTLAAHPLASLIGAGAAGYYSEPGQAVARTLMTARPKGASALSDLVQQYTDASKISPYAQ